VRGVLRRRRARKDPAEEKFHQPKEGRGHRQYQTPKTVTGQKQKIRNVDFFLQNSEEKKEKRRIGKGGKTSSRVPAEVDPNPKSKDAS